MVALTCGEACLKYLLIIFNFCFWVAGMAILAVGLWLRFDKTVGALFGDSSAMFFIGVYFLIAVGSLIMVVGFLGCCGAMMESQCMLGTFFSFLLVIFAVEVAAGAWAFVNRSKVVDQGTGLYTQIYNSGDKEKLKAIHFGLNCCGLNEPKDSIISCPASVTKGCTAAIAEFFNKQLLLIGAVGIGIGLVMVFGMVFSLCLCCAIGRTE